MTRRRFYLRLVALVLLGGIAVAVAPAETLVVLSFGVPISIAGAFVSVVYLRLVYRRQPKPRSRFFGMVVELFGGLLVVGAWIGYLTVARLLERIHAAGGAVLVLLPAPGPTHSAPISALIVIAVFASPIRFAAEVYRLRRAASKTLSTSADDVLELDRETETESAVLGSPRSDSEGEL